MRNWINGFLAQLQNAAKSMVAFLASMFIWIVCIIIVISAGYLVYMKWDWLTGTWAWLTDAHASIGSAVKSAASLAVSTLYWTFVVAVVLLFLYGVFALYKKITQRSTQNRARRDSTTPEKATPATPPPQQVAAQQQGRASTFDWARTRRVAVRVFLILILLYGVLCWFAIPTPVATPASNPVPQVAQSSQPTPVGKRTSRLGLFLFGEGGVFESYEHRYPAAVALPVIAECVSGGKQFEADGVTPLWNKEGSTAVGKYQILASAHQERALKFGHDILTLEGNEEYAKLLYAEEGDGPWRVDYRDRDCLRRDLPDIRNVTYSPDKFWVKATREWSPKIKLPSLRQIEGERRKPVTWQVESAAGDENIDEGQGDITTYLANDRNTVETEEPFWPWFRIQTVDADDEVIIDYTVFKPRVKR